MTRRNEWLGLAAIVALAAGLRYAYFGLLEFQGDEAYAANLALQFVKTGKLPLAGLMSSVGVTNPPLFIYLLIPMFALNASPVFVSGCIALLGLAAVVLTWHIGRKYYGPAAGLVAGLFFAVSPWAVIYSRKIWAQDFVPVFATATMWAVHALVLGKKPKAIFWCVLLPLCVVQIHFSGLALTAAVVVIVAWLRPKIDWRFAAAGLAAAVVTLAPYLYLQQKTNWGDFRQAMNTVGGGQQWEQLHGVTTHPVSGYRLPSKQNVSYALAIMNGGRIEDVLGIAADGEFDRAQIWSRKAAYFTRMTTLGDGPLLLQRLAFVVAFGWLLVIAVKGVRAGKVTEDPVRTAWILVVWVVVPVAVFTGAGLWTYLTYFAILFPVHFLACGAAAQRLKPVVVWSLAVLLAAGNVVFMLDYYRFVDRNGGAQGSAGTALGHKLAAAQFLAEQGGARLHTECESQLAQAPIRQPQLIEFNHDGKPELPQLEWPLLIAQQPTGAGGWPTNLTVFMVDGNREAFPPQLSQQLGQLPGTNFGPIKLYLVKR